jgi:hypothetical protein
MDTLADINATEDALQAAWRRGDGATALELQARLTGLWGRRRAELAARGAPAAARAPEPLRGVKGPRWRGGR